MSVGKIREFDMASGNWALYCDRVDMFFKANAVKEELKLPTFISLVGEQVYELIVNLANPKKPSELSYVQIVNLVREHLQPKPSIMAERFKFRQKRQENGESVMQYIAVLNKMSRTCEFGNQLNDNLRDQFVCGVGSDLIRQRLFAEKELTFANAVAIATALEAAERDSAAVESAPDASRSAAVHDIRVAPAHSAPGRGVAAGGTRRSLGPCSACAAPDHSANSCKYVNFVCSSCLNKGHLKRACPYRSVRGSAASGTQRRAYGKPLGRGRSQEAHFMGREKEAEVSGAEEKSSDEEPMWQMDLSSYKPVSMMLLVNNHNLRMEVDTGTACSCINRRTYESLYKDIELESCNLVFKFYDGSKLTPLGFIKVKVQYGDITKVLDLYVVDKGVTSLIGRQWLSELSIQVPMFRVNDNFKIENVQCTQLRDILNRYKEVLSGGLGRFTGGEAQLRVREGAVPVFCRARPLPYAMRVRVDAELDAMLRAGVIEPVECSDWATPLVPVNKSDGTLRLCADFKVTLNPVLMVDRYPLPRVDDLFANLAGGEEFSKIDLSQAYNQIVLSEDSKRYTVVNTHRGLFRYNRLVFGLSSSSGIFQRIMSNMVKDIPYVQAFLDDLICTGPDRETHLRSLKAVFEKLESLGLRVKESKCSFLAKEIKYLGYIINKQGIRPDKQKLKAIIEMPCPTNVSELKSFLGTVNFYGRFVRGLSEVLHPLHELLRKGKRWSWSSECQEAFVSVKKQLLGTDVLVHYDPRRQLVLTCDASAVGVGGVLAQLDEAGHERPVAYVSRKLTRAEYSYSQIHKEALAIVYCVKKFHQYLYGRKFMLRTDHKPLVSIFGPHQGIPTMAASRMQRWALLLSAYNFEISYVSTDKNWADVLSRLPVDQDDDNEPPEQTYLHFASEAMSLDREAVKKETARDPLLSRVSRYIEAGWPQQVDVRQLEPYHNRRDELYVELGCIMWGHRLVVPAVCRCAVLRELHEPHMGIVRTKAHARSYVWWPGLDEDVEAACRACVVCAELAPAPPAAPPQPWRWPHRPYERVHIDFLGPIYGEKYLVTIDARSKWIEAFKMASTTAGATIARLRESWSRWGLPKQVVSDNGPPFASQEFNNFLNANKIIHTFAAPYHPASNGAAENAVKIIKNVIKKARHEGTNAEVAIWRYLLVYHNTPHSLTGESPARMLQGRSLRTRLDALRPEQDHLVENKLNEKYKSLKPGRSLAAEELVWYRDFGKDLWAEGQVIKQMGKNNYSVKACDGSMVHRHVDQLKRRSRSSCVFPSESAKVDASGAAESSRVGASAGGASADAAGEDRSGVAGVSQTVESAAHESAGLRGEMGGSAAVDTVTVENEGSGQTAVTSPEQRPKRVHKPPRRYGFEFD